MAHTRKDAESVALDLLAGLVREGGATVALRHNDSVPRSGYAVGGYRTRELALSDVTGWQLTSWIETVRRNGAVQYVGVWQHGHMVYLDGVTIFDDRELALKHARAAGELALYDLAAAALIHTN